MKLQCCLSVHSAGGSVLALTARQAQRGIKTFHWPNTELKLVAAARQIKAKQSNKNVVDLVMGASSGGTFASASLCFLRCMWNICWCLYRQTCVRACVHMLSEVMASKTASCAVILRNDTVETSMLGESTNLSGANGWVPQQSRLQTAHTHTHTHTVPTAEFPRLCSVEFLNHATFAVVSRVIALRGSQCSLSFTNNADEDPSIEGVMPYCLHSIYRSSEGSFHLHLQAAARIACHVFVEANTLSLLPVW
jgi:hypothetical protein